MLEARLLGALAINLQNTALRDELVRQFREQAGKLWEERSREATKATASIPQLRQRQRELECQAQNLGLAIAAGGESKTLRDLLDSVESEQNTIKQLLAVAEKPEEQPVPIEAVEEFLERKLNDLVALFKSDPERTELEFRKRISKLVLEPKHTSEGPVYEATGDIRLLAASEEVPHGRSGTRPEEGSPRDYFLPFFSPFAFLSFAQRAFWAAAIRARPEALSFRRSLGAVVAAPSPNGNAVAGTAAASRPRATLLPVPASKLRDCPRPLGCQ